MSFCVDIMLIKCLEGLKPQKSLFVSKFQKVRYRAARAAKNHIDDDKVGNGVSFSKGQWNDIKVN